MPFPFDLIQGLLPAQSPTVDTTLDNTNPNTGRIETARLIDVQSGDYVLDDTGHYVGMDQVAQDVQLALLTTLGSASSPIGSTLRNIRLITPNLQQQVQSAVQSALASIISANQISLGTVVVNNLGYGQVFLFVPYTNLLTGQEASSNLPIRS